MFDNRYFEYYKAQKTLLVRQTSSRSDFEQQSYQWFVQVLDIEPLGVRFYDYLYTGNWFFQTKTVKDFKKLFLFPIPNIYSQSKAFLMSELFNVL